MSLTSFKFKVRTTTTNQTVSFRCWKEPSWTNSTIKWTSNNTISTPQGSGNFLEPWQGPTVSFQYLSPGDHLIEIEPGSDGFRFSICSDNHCITRTNINIVEILQWGSNVEWVSHNESGQIRQDNLISDFCFRGQQDLQVTATDFPYFKSGTYQINNNTRSLLGTYFKTKNFITSRQATSQPTTGVDSMNNLFAGNRGNRVTMPWAFADCTNLIGATSFNSWVMFNVGSVENMFLNAFSFSAPIDRWEVSEFLRGHQGMFIDHNNNSSNIINTSTGGRSFVVTDGPPFQNLSRILIAPQDSRWTSNPVQHQAIFTSRFFTFNTFKLPLRVLREESSTTSRWFRSSIMLPIRLTTMWAGKDPSQTDSSVVLTWWFGNSGLLTNGNWVGGGPFLGGTGDTSNNRFFGWRSVVLDLTSPTAVECSTCPSGPHNIIIETFYIGDDIDPTNSKSQNFTNPRSSNTVTLIPDNNLSNFDGHKFYFSRESSIVQNLTGTYSGYQNFYGLTFGNVSLTHSNYANYIINPNLTMVPERQVVSFWGPTQSVLDSVNFIYAQGPTNSIGYRFNLSQEDVDVIDEIIQNPSDFDTLRKKAADVNLNDTIDIDDKTLIQSLVNQRSSNTLVSSFFTHSYGQYVLHPATFSISELGMTQTSPMDTRMLPYLKVGIRGMGSVKPDITQVIECQSLSYIWNRNNVTYTQSGTYYHVIEPFETYKLILTFSTPGDPGVISGSSSLCHPTLGRLYTTTGDPGGNWISSDPSVAIIDPTSGSLDTINAGNTIITYELENGCGRTFSTHSLNVNLPMTIPTISNWPIISTIGTLDKFCVGQNYQLNPIPPGGSWSSSDTNIFEISSNGVVSAVSPGVATVSYTLISSNSCPDTTTQSRIEVVNSPIAGVINSPTSLCLGSTAVIQTTSSLGGGIWVSSDPNIASIIPTSGLQAEIQGNSLGQVRITYQNPSIPGSNCPGSITPEHLLTVVGYPSVTITGPQNICLTPSSNISYSSNVPGGLFSISSVTGGATIDPNTGVITPSQIGTINVQYTLSNLSPFCNDSVTSYSVIITSPANAGTISGPDEICLGTSWVFSSNGDTGGTWYSSDRSVLEFSSFSPNTNRRSAIFTSVGNGNVIISYTVTSSGCLPVSSTFSISVSTHRFIGPVESTQTPVLRPVELCLGQTFTFSCEVDDPQGTWGVSNSGMTFQQSLSYTPTGQGSRHIDIGEYLATDTGTTEVVYEIYDPVCGTISESIQVMIFPVPSAGTITPNNLTFSCTGVNQQFTITGYIGSNPQWSSSDTSVAQVFQNGIVNSVSQGECEICFQVSSLARNCDQTDIICASVSVLSPQTAGIITGPDRICFNGTGQYSSSEPDGVWSISQGSSILSIDDNGLSTPSQNNTGSATIRYTIVSTDPLCPDIFAEFIVDVVDNISSGTITGSQSICLTDTSHYSSNVSGGVWSTDPTSIVSIDQSGNATGLQIGSATIYYSVSGTTECPGSTSSFQVSVVQYPTNIIITGETYLCGGQTYSYISNFTGGVWEITNSAFNTGTIDTQTGILTAGPNPGIVIIKYTTSNNGPCFVNTQIFRAYVFVDGTPPSCIELHSTTVGGNFIATVGGIYGSSPGQITCLGDICIGNLYEIGNPGSNLIQITSSDPSLVDISSNNLASFPGIFTLEGLSAGQVILTMVISTPNNICDPITITQSVIIYPGPDSGVISGSSYVCVGGQIQLTTSGDTGGTWIVDNQNSSINQNGLLFGVSEGLSLISYIVPGQGTCLGQQSVATFSIEISEPSIPEITSPSIYGPPDISFTQSIICKGSTTSYTGTPSGGEWSIIPITGWSNVSLALTSNVSDPFILLGDNVGYSTIRYTLPASSNCPSTFTEVQLKVDSLISPVITGTNQICQGSRSTLIATPGGGIWSSLNPSICDIDSVGEVEGISPGSTTLTYCYSHASLGYIPPVCGTVCANFAITVITSPTPIISGPTQVCAGETRQFTGTPGGGIFYSSDIQNLNSSSYVDPSTGNVVFDPNDGGNTVEIFYEVSSPCGDYRDSIMVEIIQPTIQTYTVSSQSPYIWPVNSQSYTSSGTYLFIQGCITHTLILTITECKCWQVTNITGEHATFGVIDPGCSSLQSGGTTTPQVIGFTLPPYSSWNGCAQSVSADNRFIISQSGDCVRYNNGDFQCGCNCHTLSNISDRSIWIKRRSCLGCVDSILPFFPVWDKVDAGSTRNECLVSLDLYEYEPSQNQSPIPPDSLRYDNWHSLYMDNIGLLDMNEFTYSTTSGCCDENGFNNCVTTSTTTIKPGPWEPPTPQEDCENCNTWGITNTQKRSAWTQPTLFVYLDCNVIGMPIQRTISIEPETSTVLCICGSFSTASHITTQIRTLGSCNL